MLAAPLCRERKSRLNMHAWISDYKPVPLPLYVNTHLSHAHYQCCSLFLYTTSPTSDFQYLYILSLCNNHCYIRSKSMIVSVLTWLKTLSAFVFKYLCICLYVSEIDVYSKHIHHAHNSAWFQVMTLKCGYILIHAYV